MSTLLRFPLEQCRPVSAYAARRAGEVVIFPGVRIERIGFDDGERETIEADQRREG